MKGSEGSYKLTHATRELNRLDVQHRMWTLLIGGLYPSHLSVEVERLLTREGNHVLDVGCGSGIWAIEVAERFPKARIVGIDLVPPKYHRSLPHNVSFEQRDLANNLPLDYSHKFDVIHCRCVCQHVPNPQALINEMTRCLKPGGLIFIADGDWIAYDERKKQLDPFIYDASIDIEENIINMYKLSCYAGWLRIFGKITRSPNYQLPNVLLERTHSFNNIQFVKYWAPIGWAGEDIEYGHEIGDVMHTNLKEFFQTTESVVVAQGIPAAVARALKEGALEELNDRRYNTWYYASASAVTSKMGPKARM